MSEHTLPADHETDLTGQWVSKRRTVVGDATTNRIESREPLVALSFSAFRCDIDPESGRILRKQYLK